MPASGNEEFPLVPTTKNLMDVSRKLTTDWKMFVREIGVPDSEIYAIVEQHRYEPLEQKYQCLCYWLDDEGDQASFKQLIDGAWRSGQGKLAKSIEAVSKRDFPVIAKKRKRRNRKQSEDAKPPLPIDNRPQQPKPDVLDLSHFWPYRCLRHVQAHLPFLNALIRVLLLLIVVLQLISSMLLLALSVYRSANQHSCISSQKGVFMFLTVFLYVYTRGLLPLVTVCAFSSAVISKQGAQSSSLASDFLKLINRRNNEPVLQAVVRTFWDVGLAKKTYPKILHNLTQHLANELGVMCVTSILEAILVTLILVQVGATRFALDAYAIPLGGVVQIVIEGLDALFYLALILMIGIIASFFNHEATLNRLVAGGVALEDHAASFGVEPSQELIASAKITVNNFSNSWSIAEIFLFLSVQLYTFILLLFAGAGLPLSCGITAHMPGEQIHLYWIMFVIAFSFGHFLSTCVWPSAHGASVCRIAGILLEAILFVILYIVQPPLFGSFLQILFAVMPASYLFWYLWIKVDYENSVQSAKPKGWRRRHQRNMGIYICLMVQLVVTIIVSIFSEFSIIQANPMFQYTL